MYISTGLNLPFKYIIDWTGRTFFNNLNIYTIKSNMLCCHFQCTQHCIDLFFCPIKNIWVQVKWMNVLEIPAQKHTVLNFLVAKRLSFYEFTEWCTQGVFLLYKIFKYDVFKRLKTHIKPDYYLLYFKTKISLVTCVGRKLARPTLAWSRLASLSINFTVSPQRCKEQGDLLLWLK